MDTPNPMQEMMQGAVEAAFLKVLQDALQPVVVRLTGLEAEVAVLVRQQGELLAIIDAVRSGNGMVAKLLKAG